MLTALIGRGQARHECMPTARGLQVKRLLRKSRDSVTSPQNKKRASTVDGQADASSATLGTVHQAPAAPPTFENDADVRILLLYPPTNCMTRRHRHLTLWRADPGLPKTRRLVGPIRRVSAARALWRSQPASAWLAHSREAWAHVRRPVPTLGSSRTTLARALTASRAVHSAGYCFHHPAPPRSNYARLWPRCARTEHNETNRQSECVIGAVWLCSLQ